MDEYLQLQRIVYIVTEAVRHEVQVERMYLCSFGRNEGNAHVHWHVAPVPQGLPFHEQGPGIFRPSRLQIPQKDQAALAARLRQQLQNLQES
jgi:diadenosine tetraphosphate (Ap4A) HIT family hydrolase